jgi:hypothetical protein
MRRKGVRPGVTHGVGGGAAGKIEIAISAQAAKLGDRDIDSLRVDR